MADRSAQRRLALTPRPRPTSHVQPVTWPALEWGNGAEKRRLAYRATR